ncbi:MAG: pyridoxamine kinase [Bacteroidetes bacterium]|nr:MAG: pyridoxamine kinase [Bacteroidota bacterium]
MKNTIKKIAAIHDLSGIGRVSLTSVIPILSSMGIQVCPLPTAVLSSHTQYPDFYKVDLTEHLLPFIKHWKELKLDFDAVYSGYLASAAQVKIVEYLIDTFYKKDMLVVVDPVMGDNGSRYASLGMDLVKEMQRLIQKADVITPNLTEAALLLDEDYTELVDINTIKQWLMRLSEKGPSTVIITSVPELPKNKTTSVIAYESKTQRFWKVSCHYLPANYPGTGDSFTSALTGSLLQGDSLPIALDRAVQFISYGVRATFGHNYDTREGIMLERILKNLDNPVSMGTYELLD